MKKETRIELASLVKAREDLIEMRKSVENRLELKKDGSKQNKDNMGLASMSIQYYVDLRDTIKDAIKDHEKAIVEIVEADPLWEGFLKDVKGCGPMSAAAIMSQIDIEVSETRTRLYQFCGINPNPIYGKKKDSKGNIVTTKTKVRGDKKTPGFLVPYNTWLRAKLIGVMAPSMIKSKSSYKDIYDAEKARLEKSDLLVEGSEKTWAEDSKLHRNNAATRKMIKAFLSDLYENWRQIEGLEVKIGSAH